MTGINKAQAVQTIRNLANNNVLCVKQNVRSVSEVLKGAEVVAVAENQLFLSKGSAVFAADIAGLTEIVDCEKIRRNLTCAASFVRSCIGEEIALEELPTKIEELLAVVGGNDTKQPLRFVDTPQIKTPCQSHKQDVNFGNC